MGVETATLALIATAVSTAAAGYGVMEAQSQSAYQAGIAQRNEALMQRNEAKAAENARKAVEDAQNQTVDQGDLAREQIAALVAEQSRSGLNLSVGTSLLRTRQQQNLAVRDNVRLRERGNVQAEALRNQGADFGTAAQGERLEASAARTRGSNATTAGLFDIGSSLIGGATTYRRLKASETNRTAGI